MMRAVENRAWLGSCLPLPKAQQAEDAVRRK
ncbi:hypothetical protein BROSI_A1045 [Candidatus Brocadia sinica JPN1]|uniref:Uncharacterized protein n=1 Tax=Candidatus Brocadia sinica JPN1 TaxID=1197129 RepID=A0ABQ0JUY3_9BACT|nr:hypothetical protein BROSI_A1045 [Candidatus Brocadia sinica JPN1]